MGFGQLAVKRVKVFNFMHNLRKTPRKDSGFRLPRLSRHGHDGHLGHLRLGVPGRGGGVRGGAHRCRGALGCCAVVMKCFGAVGRSAGCAVASLKNALSFCGKVQRCALALWLWCLFVGPEQVLGKLQEAWMNEKHSPELLEPRSGFKPDLIGSDC